jgi:hypothetical protein
MSNYGAFVYGVRPKSKKALREALDANPDSVTFDDTSAFNNRGLVHAEELNPSAVIVGPDPYTSRKWYANVVLSADRLSWKVK